MISSKEALDIIVNQVLDFGTEKVALEQSTGRCLARKLKADRDFPPFDRVCMDGIAVQFDSLKDTNTLRISGTQLAGDKQTKLENALECIEVMTGASLPKGTDTVIPFEHIRKNRNRYKIIDKVRKGQNIHFKGEDRKKRDILLDEHRLITGAEVASLATLGIEKVKVKRLPKTAIVSTGNELVDISEKPKPHQIRMSNAAMLQSLLNEHHISSDLFHITDNAKTLKKRIAKILKKYDLVLFSGGVSKGKADYLPEVLEKTGVKKLFHRVQQRPGKPFWFGAGEETTVFAFPGNPISTFCCFQKYFKPWINACQRIKDEELTAVLTDNFTFRPKLTYFLQVKTSRNKQSQLEATPVKGNGSGDLANLLDADSLLELPAHRTNFKRGEVFPIISFR